MGSGRMLRKLGSKRLWRCHMRWLDVEATEGDSCYRKLATGSKRVTGNRFGGKIDTRVMKIPYRIK